MNLIKSVLRKYEKFRIERHNKKELEKMDVFFIKLEDKIKKMATNAKQAAEQKYYFSKI